MVLKYEVSQPSKQKHTATKKKRTKQQKDMQTKVSENDGVSRFWSQYDIESAVMSCSAYTNEKKKKTETTHLSSELKL